MAGRLAGALTIAAAALAISATAASAASTRAEYVAQVDQVCTAAKPRLQAADQRIVRIIKKGGPGIFPGGASTGSEKKLVKRLKRQSRRIDRAERTFNGLLAAEVEGIAMVASAPGDEAAVGQWVGGLRQFLQLRDASNAAARRGKLARALNLIDQSTTALDTGGAAVLGFGIIACPTSSQNPLF